MFWQSHFPIWHQRFILLSVCRWNDTKWPICSLACVPQPFPRWTSCSTHSCTTKIWFLRHVKDKMKQGKINGTRSRQSGREFVGFEYSNVIFDSLVFVKYNIEKAWSHSGAHWCRSTMRFLLSQRWADYQLWNSRPPSAQTSGHACASTSQGLPVSSIDCMLWFCHLLQAVLTVTGVTLFSCLLSTHFTAAWLWRVLRIDMFVLVSHHRSALLGRPKVSYLWTLWHWEVRDYFKPRNISVSTFQRNSAPPARPELHLLPGNNSLLNILSGSIEINWERVSGSEA